MVSTEVDIANIALQRLGQPIISTLTESSRDASICNQLYDQNRDYCLMLGDWDCAVNRRVMTRANKTEVAGASQADPVVITTTPTHTFVANEIIYVESCAGMTQINENYYRIFAVTSTTISIYDVNGTSIDGTSYTAWTSGGYIFRDPTPDWEYVYDLPSDCLKVLAVLDEDGGEVDGEGLYRWKKERSFIFCDLENAGVKYIKKETDPSLYESDLVEVMASRLARYISMRIHSDKELRNEIYGEMQQAIARAKVTNAQGANGEEPGEDLWVDAR